MNEGQFNIQLNKLNPEKDVQLLYDQERKRWGLYQVRARNIILAGPQTVRPWLLWHCEEADGSFRLPDNRDLARFVQTVHSRNVLQEKGGDWYANKVDEAEARNNAANSDHEARMKWAQEGIRGAVKGRKTTRLSA